MVKTSWPQGSLGEHVDLLTGFPFKSKFFTNDPQDIPLVKGDNVQQAYIDWDIAKRWPRDDVQDYERYRLHVGDVILAMDRPWIEAGLKHAWIKKHDPGCLLVQRTARLRGDKSLLTGYLRYLIASPAFTAYIRPIVTGVNVPHISPQQIKDFKFRLPPFDVQRKAVAILSAFDDLLENNLRRIRILEDIARTVFTEWFVKFRFPEYRERPGVDSQNGRIPEGWEIKSITDVPQFRLISENIGPYDGKKLYHATADVQGISIVKDGVWYFYHEKPSRAQKQPTHDSVWFARMRDSYKVLCFADANRDFAEQVILSSGFAGFEAADGWLGFLYYTINSEEFHRVKDQFCTGATQVSLTNEGLSRIQIRVPPDDLVQEYEKVAKPVVNEILTLQTRNGVLRNTRDLLLPRLVSGELDVSCVDIELEDDGT